MAIKVQNTTVINDSRGLENITNLKTIGGESILGSGDIAVTSSVEATMVNSTDSALNNWVKVATYTPPLNNNGTISEIIFSFLLTGNWGNTIEVYNVYAKATGFSVTPGAPVLLCELDFTNLSNSNFDPTDFILTWNTAKTLYELWYKFNAAYQRLFVKAVTATSEATTYTGDAWTIQTNQSQTTSSPNIGSFIVASLMTNATVPIAQGGTGQTSQTAAFDALSPATTKGDLIVDNGTNNIRLAVGTDGHVLTADSSVAAGVKWAAAAGGGSSALTISNKTANYTVVSGDLGTIINYTSNIATVSLTAAATLGSGFNCWIWNTGTGVVTIDPDGSETIDGLSTLALRQGEGLQIVCDGINWQTGDKKTMRGYVENVPAGARPSVSASYGTAIGFNSAGNGSVSQFNSGAMALGGSYASGSSSFAAAVANNTSSYGAQGSNSVVLGKTSVSTDSDSAAIGTANISSSINAFSLGNYNIASGYASTCIGNTNTASGESSVVLGTFGISNLTGKIVLSSGAASAYGDSQTGHFVLRRTTSNSTPITMNTGSTGASSNSSNQVILPNNSAYAFSGIIIARQKASDGTASAAWEVKGLIRREGSAGTTVLVNSATTVISNVPGWSLALSADTTNGGLAVTVTGAASTNIRWVATIQTSEVTYA